MGFEERIRILESRFNELRKIKESFELYIDSLAVFSASASILCDSLAKHYSMSSSQETKPYENVVNLFGNVTSDITNIVQPAIRATISNRCLRPINAILVQSVQIFEKIARFKSMLSDFEYYNSKSHKDAKVVTKIGELTKEIIVAQDDIEESLSQFEAAFPTMLGNELVASIASMSFYFSSSAVLYNELLPFIPQAASTLCILSLTTASAGLLKSPKAFMEAESSKDVKPLTPIAPILARSGLSGGSHGEYGILGLPSPLPPNFTKEDDYTPVAADMARPRARSVASAEASSDTNATPVKPFKPVKPSKFRIMSDTVDSEIGMTEEQMEKHLKTLMNKVTVLERIGQQAEADMAKQEVKSFMQQVTKKTSPVPKKDSPSVSEEYPTTVVDDVVKSKIDPQNKIQAIMLNIQQLEAAERYEETGPLYEEMNLLMRGAEGDNPVEKVSKGNRRVESGKGVLTSPQERIRFLMDQIRLLEKDGRKKEAETLYEEVKKIMKDPTNSDSKHNKSRSMSFTEEAADSDTKKDKSKSLTFWGASR